MAKKKAARSESLESQLIVQHAFGLARSLGISKLLVQADELWDIRVTEGLREKERIVWLTRGDSELPLAEKRKDRVVTIPDIALTRMSQLKVGLLSAILSGHVELDETVLCLSGVAGSERLDMMLITNPKRDFPWFRKYPLEKTQGSIATREFVRVVDIALRLAREGREGRPIGTMFVLGNVDELSPYLRQLVLSPCEGHPQRDRSIHDEEFFETLRKFAALDGAFVVINRGIVESAGTYVDAPARKARLSSGLGARHAAAAAVTAETDALGVVVSASSGTVTVFHEGKPILELEKPQAETEAKPGRGKPD